jgi:hypothetical protein
MAATRGPDPYSGRLAPMGPLTNRLLASLPGACLRLHPELQRVQLSQGQVLVDAGRVPSHI